MSYTAFPSFSFPGVHSTPSSSSKKPDFDELEYLIAKKLDDPEKAEVIRNVYEKHLPDLVKVWNGFESIEFQGWLMCESKFLGALSVDHLDLALRTFPAGLLRDFQQKNGYAARTAALKEFVDALQEAWGKNLKEVIQLPPANPVIDPVILTMLVRRTIVVLTRNCGNGHNTASAGIKQFLEKKGYKVHLINGSDFSHNQFVNSKFSQYAFPPSFKTETKDLRTELNSSILI